jgi:oligosaccharide repeat unit polymerase
MNYLDLALLFFLLLTVLNYRAQHSVLYPPFIFCITWLLDLALIRSGIIEVDPVHGNTLAIVAAGAASFSVGGLLAGLAPQALLRIHLFPPRPKRHPGFLRNMVMIVLLCGLPVIFHQILQLSNSGGGGFNILLQARVALVESIQSGDSSQLRVLGYFTMIATFASLLLATEKSDRQFWIVSIVALIGCILSTGRTDILIVISGLSAIRLLQTKRESLSDAMRLLRWPVALFAALYVGLTFTNKNTEEMAGGVTGVLSFYVLSYIVGPLAAFDKVVQHPTDFMRTASHTFDFPLKVAAALHLTDYTKPPLFDSFVFVPFPTNVYTVFKFYFIEWGTIGTVVLLLFFGLLHSLLYLKARQGGRLSTYLFAYSLFSVLIVIFDDHYCTIEGFIYAIVFGVLYFIIGSIPFRLFPAIEVRGKSNQSLSSDSTTS